MKPAASLQGARGAYFLFLPARYLVASQFYGYITIEAAEALRDFGTRQFNQGRPIQFFHDWEQVTGYDSAARQLLTSWSIECRSHIRGVVVLTKSKLVAMGVATANLATSALGVEMRSHTDRKAYERELMMALPQ